MENTLNLAAIVLIILWLIGYVGLGMASGFVHVLLVLAIVVVMLRLITDRKPIL